MEIQDFFDFVELFLPSWIRIRNLNADADPDPTTQINADPCGSGSETLHFKSEFIFIPGSKRYHIPDPQHCCSKKIPELEIRLWTQSYGSGIRYLFDPGIRGKNSRS
jgi:hypothetical protein